MTGNPTLPAARIDWEEILLDGFDAGGRRVVRVVVPQEDIDSVRLHVRAVSVRIASAPEEVLAARCPGCGYTYEVAVGNELEGFAAGTAWADIPDSWCCPDCGVREKVDFVPLTRAVAR